MTMPEGVEIRRNGGEEEAEEGEGGESVAGLWEGLGGGCESRRWGEGE